MSRTNCTRLGKDNSQPRAKNLRMVKDNFYLSIFKYFYFLGKNGLTIQIFVTGHFRRFFQCMQRVFLKNAEHVKPIRIQATIYNFSFRHLMAYEEVN